MTRPTAPPRRLLTLSRLWWALLVLVHVPAVTGVITGLIETPSLESVLAALAVALTVGFFVAKLIDVPWLRWRSRRGGAIVFLIIAALVHRGAVMSVAENEMTRAVPAVLATGGTIMAVRRARPTVRRWFTRLTDSMPSSVTALSHRLVGVLDDAPPCVRLTPATIGVVPRGPPA